MTDEDIRNMIKFLRSELEAIQDDIERYQARLSEYDDS